MSPDSLTLSCTSEEFLTLLCVSCGISWHSLLCLACSHFFVFRGTAVSELTFITNKCIIAFPTDYFLCSSHYFIFIIVYVLMAIHLLM